MATLSFASKSIKNISNTIQSRTATRRSLTSDILGIKNRRIENERRLEKQDEINAVSRVQFPKGPSSLALAQSGGSFVSRILGFIGFVSSGWLLSNARTWIAGGKELIGRIQTLQSTFTGFVFNIARLMSDMGRVANAFFQNMIVFDFKDTDYRIGQSMEDLNTTLDNMNQQIFSAFNVLTEPFTKVPPLGSKGEEDAYTREEPSGQPSGQPTPSGGGGGQWKPLLDAISEAESKQNGYNAIAPGDYNPNLSKMTISEANKSRGVRGGNGAIGRYQLTNPIRQAALANLKSSDLFSPENQDKIAIALIKQRGVSINMIKNDPEEASVRLGAEWAGLPLLKPANGRGVGQSYYEGFSGNSATISTDRLRRAFSQIASSSSNQQQLNRQTQSITPTQQTSTKQKLNLNKLGFSVGERAGYSQSRGRIHSGRDIAIESGTPLSVITDATITDVGNDAGGYGYFVAYVDSKGIEHFYGHLREMSKVSKGQKFSAGSIIGYVGSTGSSTGPHLHWEVSPRMGEVGRPRSKVIDPIEYGYSSSAPFGGKISAPSSSLTPSAPSASTPSADNQAQVETQQKTFLDEFLAIMSSQKKGEEIVLINDISPSSSGQIAIMGGTSSGASVNEIDVLNSFIKNKLLLDLNYL